MKLEGEVAELDLIEDLVGLGREYFTGAIRFENDGIIKILYLKGGDILSASTNDRADSVDEILLRASKVTREHVKQALSKRKENETLGDALLNLGFITRKELTWARRVQAVGVIRSITEWSAGTYTMVADYLPKREEGTLFPLRQIVIEVIVTDQDRPRYERALESGTAVFEKASDFDQEFARLGLNEDADAITAQIDGNHTAADIAEATGKDDFNVYKLLHALAAIGLLHRTGGRVVAAADADADVIVPEEPGSAEFDWTPPDMGAFQFEDAAVEPPAPVLSPADPEPSEVTSGLEMIPEGAIETPIEEIPESWGPPIPSTIPSAISSTGPLPDPSPGAPPADGWGFDAAQVETVARSRERFGSVAGSRVSPAREESEVREPRSRFGPILAIVILAAAAVAGWLLWSGREAGTPAPEVATDAATAPNSAPATISSPPEIEPLASPPEATPPTPTATTATTATMSVPPPAVTPAPAAPQSTAPAAAAGDRYERMAREFAKPASGNFTIQFELVCRAASLEKAMKAGGTNVWFIPTAYRGQPCYRVFWGRYATRAAAAGAAGEIPAAIRGTNPVVVAVPKS